MAARRYDVPLVADIHFQPYIAMMVAECFEKIRINPGNFADGRKTFEVINYDDPKQFAEERAYIEEVRQPPSSTMRCPHSASFSTVAHAVPASSLCHRSIVR